MKRRSGPAPTQASFGSTIQLSLFCFKRLPYNPRLPNEKCKSISRKKLTLKKIMGDPVKFPKFRVIEGGKSSSNAEVDQFNINYFHSLGNSPSTQESNRLRRAMLSLRVDEAGQTVEETLQEINAKLDTGTDEDFARVAFINARLEYLGLKFCLARLEMNLVREGYLMLVWPDRLLRKHPELAGLHPLAHQALTFG
jgi:hypothetical protein